MTPYDQKLKEIGKRIKYFRRKAGYSSYEKFAIEHDFNRMTVWRAENGKRINLRTLFKILDKLNVSLGEFFEPL